MKNYWVNESRIREAVNLLNKLLSDEFVGHMPSPEDVGDFVNDLIEVLYDGDEVILNGLSRYVVALYFDDYSCIKELKLIEK
jgi:GTP1/Obg family GTP-binding protein